MRRPAIGLDIGTTAVRAAELSTAKHGVRLQRFAEAPLPEGAVVEGGVADVEVVAATLRQMWSEHRFRSKHVVLGVANPRVIVRQVDLPRLPAADLKHALPFQVQDLLPIPVETAVMDFVHLEDTVTPDGAPGMRGLLVAASREMVLDNVRAAHAAGLVVRSVDLTPFALLRAAGSRAYGEVDTEAVVDIGARVTNIVVHSRGLPRFVRILLSGGRDVTDAIAEGLGVPAEEAEEVKRRTGAEAQERALGGTGVALDAAQDLVDGVRRSLDYHSAADPAHLPQRLVVSGGGSLLQGLGERLTEATRLPVVAADPLAGLDAAADGEDLARWQPVAAVPLGLAMAGAR